MDENLQHDDLLIKIRAKLNEDKIKLWEPPYCDSNNEITSSLQSLAEKYSTALSIKPDIVLEALRELQLHSLERSKANTEFKESGVATLRVKVTVPGSKSKVLNVQKKLSVTGAELFTAVASQIGVSESRLKLIYNGKVLKPGPSLEDQGVKNSAQIMALLLAEEPEKVKKEDSMYLEMKSTKEDATLLSEYVDDLAEDDDEYMKLEDQAGKTVEVPAATRRALLVGLALHARARAALRDRNYPLALLLLLEADDQLGLCGCSILQQVDNWAVLQLDVAWCYLCLQNLASTADAALRLQRAEDCFRRSYGDNMERLIALKGSAENERVLLMRLYLLQGIVSYHQNKREDASRLLEKAETELNALRVDEECVRTLAELGWSRAEARAGLRAAGGDVTRAHNLLEQQQGQREEAREKHRRDRKKRALGVCMDGSAVEEGLVTRLVEMGFTRALAVVALRNTNNHVAEAVRLIQEQPELLVDSDHEDASSGSANSEESMVEPDNKLLAELEAMGFDNARASAALREARNQLPLALDALGASHASTSRPANAAHVHKSDKRKRERQKALQRLSSTIRTEEYEHLDTSLVQEEQFLVQYKSLL